jgi:hypothetical protein
LSRLKNEKQEAFPAIDRKLASVVKYRVVPLKARPSSLIFEYGREYTITDECVERMIWKNFSYT